VPGDGDAFRWVLKCTGTTDCYWTPAARVGDPGSMYAVIYQCVCCGDTFQPRMEMPDSVLWTRDPNRPDEWIPMANITDTGGDTTTP
jgi:hypothetical protein